MSTIQPLMPAEADPAIARTLDAVRGKLGMLPNLIATLAHAPAALNAYLGLSEMLAGGRLTARQREIVALAVAQTNACEYCLSAHTQLARHAGLDDDQIRDAREARGGTTLDAAIARYAAQLARPPVAGRAAVAAPPGARRHAAGRGDRSRRAQPIDQLHQSRCRHRGGLPRGRRLRRWPPLPTVPSAAAHPA